MLKSTITEIQAYTEFPGVNPSNPKHNIYSSQIADNVGLSDSIHYFINEIMQSHPLKIIFQCFENFDAGITKKMKINILTIVQEHIKKIVDEGKVMEINIKLSQSNNRVLLSIADDNVRFGSTTGAYLDMINIKRLERLNTGNLNLIYNPSIGNCLVYHQNIN